MKAEYTKLVNTNATEIKTQSNLMLGALWNPIHEQVPIVHAANIDYPQA